jgi:flagella basal body P-ring formation protein FlgA
MKRNDTRSAWIPSLLLASVAGAQSWQAPQEIQKAAEDFLVAQFSGADHKVFASADALDPRLRLAACTQPLEASVPNADRVGARVTVGVKCPAPRWVVYVPARIETEMEVLALRRALDRGSPVTAADVEQRTLRVPGLSAGYINNVEQLAGRHLRRQSAPGTALTADLLAQDILVRRGQRVALVISAGGLEVRAQGEAIADATPAGRVRVLNLASRRIVEGQVESSEVVRVSL